MVECTNAAETIKDNDYFGKLFVFEKQILKLSKQ